MDCSPPSTSVHGILPGKSTGVGFPSGKVLTFCDSLSPYVKWCVCVCVCVCVWCVWCVWCVCVSSILPSIRPIQSRHSSFLFPPTPPNLEAGHKDMVKRTLHFWAPLTFAFLLPFLPVFFFLIYTQFAHREHLYHIMPIHFALQFSPLLKHQTRHHLKSQLTTSSSSLPNFLKNMNLSLDLNLWIHLRWMFWIKNQNI